jgi:hypothetical protein
MSDLRWGSHTEQAYSRDDLTNDLFSCNKTPVKFKYCLHGHVLESVDKAKYLGVTISEDLKWESHINTICGKLKPIRFLASCVAT